MFALNGRSPFSNLIGHWAVHFQGNESKIWKRTDLNRTIEIIGKSKADIIAIAEILEGQEKELEDKLRGLGYRYIFFGKGHKTKFRKLYVKVAIASKFKCKQIEIFDFPVKNEMGGGGGIIRCSFPELKLNLINVHLACVKKRVYQEQIKFLEDYVKEIKGKLILMGDFNLRYKEIKDSFKTLKLISDEIKTCSVTPLFNWFSCKDLDHILVKGLEKKNLGELKGYSDHKLIWADLY